MDDRPRLYLFSVDLEDIRRLVPGGQAHPERVTAMTDRILGFLSRHRARATFFTVGDVLRTHPALIDRLLAEGHELACHTDTHRPLDQLGREGFQRDLEAWTGAVARGGWPSATGFRAPTFSLTAATVWAYGCLTDFGFTYSSSVLPAGHPLYGWPEHGEEPRWHGTVLELPMNLGRVGPWRVPLGGGVYFRATPGWSWRRWFLAMRARGEPIRGYLHPYDLDEDPPPFPYPALPPGPWWQWVMRRGRSGVLSRLEWVMKQGFQILPYRDYLHGVDHALAST
jgi:peptidoglycan/xylan/chitin deacetylase (PgdA/CDA1 family)